MPINSGMYSSDKLDWETPSEIFEPLNAEFGFDLDVCAIPQTAKCKKFYTPEDDALKQEWSGTCWMNPPYGREIKKWVKKAFESSQKGATIVCLVPARTDTSWWHDYCMKADEIRFIRGRIYFLQNGVRKTSAPFPSAVVIFKGDKKQSEQTSTKKDKTF